MSCPKLPSHASTVLPLPTPALTPAAPMAIWRLSYAATGCAPNRPAPGVS